jgi:hypothetical protein
MRIVIAFLILFSNLYLRGAFPVLALILSSLLVSLALLQRPFMLRQIFSWIMPVILLFSLAYLRAWHNGAISVASALISIVQLWLIFMVILFCKIKYFDMIFAGLIYIGFMLVLGTIHFDADLGNNRILELINIDISRMNSVLLGNFAYSSLFFGIMCGSSFITKRYLLTIIYLILLFLLDSRTAILALPLSLYFSTYAHGKFGYFVGLFILPLLMFYLSLEYGDLNLLSYRNLIWAAVVNSYDPSLFNSLFGYGYLGHFSSGVSRAYNFYFLDRGLYQSLVMSPHNSLIQAVLDYGWLGFMYLLFKISRLSSRVPNNKLLLFSLMYMTVNSGFEIVFVPPNMISMIVLGLMLNEWYSRKVEHVPLC